MVKILTNIWGLRRHLVNPLVVGRSPIPPHQAHNTHLNLGVVEISLQEWDYHKDDIRNTEYSYLSMSDSPHQHRAPMTVGSSSSAGNVPSEMEDIEFGGKIVPATAVELTPNMNSTHTGESETALTAPPSLEVLFPSLAIYLESLSFQGRM